MNVAMRAGVCWAVGVGVLMLAAGCQSEARNSDMNTSPRGENKRTQLASSAKKRVIILCTGNSCRSQMAEAFWRKYGGDEWEVISAGTKPKGHVYPLAVKAMAEKGIDISDYKSKDMAAYVDQDFDLVVTVCDNAAHDCPNFRRGRKYVHHAFDDPPKVIGDESQKMEVCRRVRDEIDAKVKEWIAAYSS